MLARLFSSKAIIDPNTQNWIFDTFAWAIEHFDIAVFQTETRLILPSNEFYPGKVSSVDEMAQAMFVNTKQYAGMQHWPIALSSTQPTSSTRISDLKLGQVLRGERADIGLAEDKAAIMLGYSPLQVNQPQDLIAAISQALARILVLANQALPPGGKDYLPQTIDLVACFMGFGVIFANTAYQFRGGCGGCNNANLNRQSALTEPETLYCLALFCVLKQQPISAVKGHLKKHLQKDFTRAYKSIEQALVSSAQPALLACLGDKISQ
ncbi:hypothetical protein SAMN05216262_103180 [Colwellia chukchiensis]|uniref:Uncharacterized protein n=1 Tax=Colwellia chukchiensis TaxID=641665 RepID=A0A1H7KKW5_9GAMM|nr:hypothetical protein [Colwellia chukchiensis]SEK87422.1 hypothetical protein SAMN05216262_103180 [Colwellia chukchiensis]